jgi:hypothetical protein
VTDAEVKAFGEYEQAIVDKKKADAEVITADKAMQGVLTSGNVEAIKAARERQAAARSLSRESAQAESAKRAEWNRLRDAGEPNHVNQYRASLLKCACVRQIFDPWFMDVNVKGGVEPVPNMQKSGNETLHAHHLHITVDEPKIL